MKRKLLYLLVLFVLTGVGIAMKVYFFDSAQTRVGHLQVYSTPDATVFIDSKAAGRTPFNQELKPGTYTIKLIPIATNPELGETSGVTWQGKITISAYQYTYVRRELRNTEVESAGEIFTIQRSPNVVEAGTGEILIETEPDGAIVSYDGQDVGVSPYLVKNAPVGVHEISVYMPKFRRRTNQVRVVSGGYTTVAHFQLGLDVDYDKKFAFGRAFEASRSASLPEVSKAQPSPTPTPKVEKIEINDTPTGFLRVRQEGNFNAKEVSQVKPGEVYTYLEEKDGWIKIKLTDGQEGWVKGEYVKKLYSANSE
jgi:hypothetical protein